MGQFISPQTGSSYTVVTAEDMPFMVCFRHSGGGQWRIRIQAANENEQELAEVLAQGLAARGWSIKSPGDHASVTVYGRDAAYAATGDAVRAVLYAL